MYRIEAKSLAYVPSTLFAVLGALLGAIWAWNAPGYVLWGLIILPFLLQLRYLTNQYQTVDPGTGVMTRPRLLFLRETLKDDSIQAVAEAVEEGDRKSYKVTITGEFGTMVMPLPSYEAYVTLVYQQQAAALGLA